ncbi:hypothetical protein TNCV_3810521 [Trichonephila clavipes]|nr:hypothetical protein TNCV_3810521 [Trichonephila clavipes]
MNDVVTRPYRAAPEFGGSSRARAVGTTVPMIRDPQAYLLTYSRESSSPKGFRAASDPPRRLLKKRLTLSPVLQSFQEEVQKTLG